MGTQLPHGKGHSSFPIFEVYGRRPACVHIIRGPCLLWPNGWVNQDAIWYGGRPRPRPHCIRCTRIQLPPKGGGRSSSQFSAHVYCGQTAGWIKMKLGVEVGIGPGHIVLDGDPAPPPQRGTAPVFGPCLLWPNGRPSQLLLSTCYRCYQFKVIFVACTLRTRSLPKCVSQ